MLRSDRVQTTLDVVVPELTRLEMDLGLIDEAERITKECRGEWKTLHMFTDLEEIKGDLEGLYKDFLEEENEGGLVETISLAQRINSTSTMIKNIVKGLDFLGELEDGDKLWGNEVKKQCDQLLVSLEVLCEKLGGPKI